MGGRAKPLQYFYRDIFADVMATCGSYSGPLSPHSKINCTTVPQPCLSHPGRTYCASNPAAGQCDQPTHPPCPPCPPSTPPQLPSYDSSLDGDSSGASNITACYVKNDSPRAFTGEVTVTAIDFASGDEVEIATVPVAMPAGVGQIQYFPIAGVPNGTTAMLHTTVKQGAGSLVSSNFVPMTEPYKFALAEANVRFSIKEAANDDGSIDIVVTSDKVAIYVTFTTIAQGRFSDNVFVMKPGTKTIRFLPIAGYFVREQLTSSLRVEHLASYARAAGGYQ